MTRHRDSREIHRLSFEIYNSPNEWASLQIDDGSGFETVGQAHIHGEWLELYVCLNTRLRLTVDGHQGAVHDTRLLRQQELSDRCDLVWCRPVDVVGVWK